MAGELQQTIDRVNAKMQILLDRYARMEALRNQLSERILELEAALEKARVENQQLRTENEFLKIATTIVPDRNDVRQTRALLSELVREIDKCIAELNE